MQTDLQINQRTNGPVNAHLTSGDQFEGDLGEILALGAEISPYIGLRKKCLPKKNKKKCFRLVSTP